MESKMAGMAGAPDHSGGARFVALGWGVGQVTIRAITDTPLEGVQLNAPTSEDQRG